VGKIASALPGPEMTGWSGLKDSLCGDEAYMKGSFLLNLASLVVVIAGIKACASVVVPFLLSAFFAVLASPILFWLRRKGLPDWFSIVFLIILFIVIETGLGALLGTSVAEFSKELPVYQERLGSIYSKLTQFAKQLGFSDVELSVLQELDVSRIMAFVASTLKSMGVLITNTFVIVLTLVFMLLEAGGMIYKLEALSLLGFEKSRELRLIIDGINSFFAIKTFTSFLTGVLIWLGLLIQGVDFPALWGVCAFALNFIPTIGSIIAAAPAVLLALVKLGFAHSLITLFIYVVVNIAVGNILEPKLMGQGVGLSPLVIFLSMAFWGWVLGPVGMFLSVPITMSIKIAMGVHKRTKWLAVLLGTNSEAAALLQQAEVKAEVEKQ